MPIYWRYNEYISRQTFTIPDGDDAYVVRPHQASDLKSRELGLYLIAGLDESLDAAKQVLALTGSALPEGSQELAKNVFQNAGEELRKAEIAIRTVHQHYANGAPRPRT